MCACVVLMLASAVMITSLPDPSYFAHALGNRLYRPLIGPEIHRRFNQFGARGTEA